MVFEKDFRSFGVTVFVALALGGLSGCSQLQLGLTAGSSPTGAVKSQTPAQASVPPAAADTLQEESNVLTAVEAFLRRTEGYQAASDPTESRSDAEPASTAANIEVDVRANPSHADAARKEPLPARVDAPLPASSEVESSSPPRTAAQKPAQPANVAVANSQLEAGVATTTAQATQMAPRIVSVSIEAPSPLPRNSNDQQKGGVLNQPLATINQADSASLDEWVAQLHKQVSERADVESAWRLVLANLALGRSTAPLQESPIPAETKGLLESFQGAAQSVGRIARSREPASDLDMKSIEEMATAIEDRADPEIETVFLCQRVVSFGVYEVIDPKSLVAGRDVPVIVYTEVDRLRSTKQEDGQYQTELATRLEVMSADGTSKLVREEPVIVDRCLRRRRDFFVAQRLVLPASLTPGEYVLKVFVEDRLSNRAHETALPFTMLESSSVAARQ